jgi:tetratricopeptide (TPR) repeat protein
MHKSDNYKLGLNLVLSFINKHILLTLFILAFLIYGNGLFNNFVIDDINQVVADPLVHSLTTMPQLFAGGTFSDGILNLQGNYYRPIMTTTYAIIYSLFGPTPFFFHLVQLVLHIFNAWLVYKLFRKWISPNFSLFGSLVFLVHPINSETVLYIANLQDTLFVFFGLSALILYTSSFTSRYKLLLTFVLLTLSLLSKETGVIFIFMLLLYQWLYNRKDIINSVSLTIVLGFIYIFLKYAIAHISSTVNTFAPITRLSFNERLLQIPAIITYYLKTFLYPKDLITVQNWIIHSATFTTFYIPLLIFIGVVIVIITAPLILLKNNKTKKKQFFYFAVWFALGLFLHLQLQPLDSTVADHWFYFPVIGLLGMILILFEKIKLQKKHYQYIAVFFCFILLFVLSVRSFLRTFNFRNQYVLAKHDLSEEPNNFVLQNIIGVELQNQGHLTDAQNHLIKATKIDPGNDMAWHNLGYLYEQMGTKTKNRELYLKADKYYQKATTIGNDPTTYVNLAELRLFKEKQNYQSLNKFITGALKKFPDQPNLRIMHAVVLYKLHDKQDALLETQRALQIEPQNTQFIQVYQWINANAPINLTP